MLQDGMGLVAGAEAEDAALAHGPHAAAAEVLALAPLFLKHDLIPRRHVEGLAIPELFAGSVESVLVCWKSSVLSVIQRAGVLAALCAASRGAMRKQ